MYNYDLIKDNLKTEYVGRTFVQFEHLQSIQSKAKKISEGSPEGMLVVTKEQDNVKTKNSKIWVSNVGKAIFFSVILKNKKDLSEELVSVGAASVIKGLAEAFESDSLVDIKVKAPNDIFVGDKKVGAVFAEKINKKNNDSMVLTVFLNASKEGLCEENTEEKDLPEDYKNVSNIIGYLGDNFVSEEILIASILNWVEIYYKQLIDTKAKKEYLEVLEEFKLN